MVNLKIAISGKARSGKNTIATMLVNNLKNDLSKEKIVALADPIKLIVKTMFPEASDECLYGPSELRSHPISDKYKDESGNILTHRQALIELGKRGRQYDNDLWLNILVQEANRSKDINTYIIADVRYPNEFYYLKSHGFTMVRILRNDSAVINDSSETEQDSIPNSDFDYIIYNNESLSELNEKIALISGELNRCE